MSNKIFVFLISMLILISLQFIPSYGNSSRSASFFKPYISHKELTIKNNNNFIGKEEMNKLVKTSKIFGYDLKIILNLYQTKEKYEKTLPLTENISINVNEGYFDLVLIPIKSQQYIRLLIPILLMICLFINKKD